MLTRLSKFGLQRVQGTCCAAVGPEGGVGVNQGHAIHLIKRLSLKRSVTTNGYTMTEPALDPFLYFRAALTTPQKILMSQRSAVRSLPSQGELEHTCAGSGRGLDPNSTHLD